MPEPINTYLQLRNAVENWLDKPNLADRIPEFIQLAENRISHELDLPKIETTVTLNITGRSAPLPSGFVEQRRAYIDVSDPVQRIAYMPPERFWDYDMGLAPGFPSFYTIERNEVLFTPPSDNDDPGYSGQWLVLVSPARLVNDSDTNDILTQHTGLYLYGSLIEAEGLLADDPRILTWATLYDQAMDMAKALSQRQRFPKGQKVMRSKVRISSGGRTKM